MVIVPGINDGVVLEQSLSDLWALGDAVLTVAIVPVGLTQFSHLYTGRSMDRANARTLLEVTNRWADRARTERGSPWVYGSDELYLLAALAAAGPGALRRLRADRERRGGGDDAPRSDSPRMPGRCRATTAGGSAW